jgi:peptidoglycan/LPS O-acetylase OafA/YrhL
VAALCLLVSTGQAGVVGRLLAWRPLVWIGSISYGLYLWHSVVFWLLAPVHTDADPTLFNISAVSLSFLVAALSYRYIERPFLLLKYTSLFIGNKPAIQPDVT